MIFSAFTSSTSAFAASSSVRWSDGRIFPARCVDGWYLKDVAVYNGDLSFLLNQATGSNQIVRVTGQGQIVGKIPLQAVPSCSTSGTFVLARQVRWLFSSPISLRPPLTTVSLYDTDGTLKTSFDVTLFNEIAFIGNDLAGIGPSGITQLTSQARFVTNGTRRAGSSISVHVGRGWQSARIRGSHPGAFCI
jgi:hypothetical protein